MRIDTKVSPAGTGLGKRRGSSTGKNRKKTPSFTQLAHRWRGVLLGYPTISHTIRGLNNLIPPLKINMEPKNHPIEKENDLPNLPPFLLFQNANGPEFIFPPHLCAKIKKFKIPVQGFNANIHDSNTCGGTRCIHPHHGSHVSGLNPHPGSITVDIRRFQQNPRFPKINYQGFGGLGFYISTPAK